MAVLNLQIEVDSSGAIKNIKQFTDVVTSTGKKGKKAGKETAKGFNTAEKSLQSLSSTAKKAGVALAAFFTVRAAIDFSKALITNFAEVEQGFIGVAKTTGIAGRELKTLEKDIKSLATTMAGVSVGGLQSIAETAGQLGITGVKDITAFTKTIAMVAVTTDLTAQEAALAFAQITNVVGEPIANVKKLAAVTNELSNTTVATARDITDLTLRMGGAGRTIGLTSAEVMAFAATIRDTGTRVEVGGTAMSRIFGKLQTDTEKFAKVAGIELSTFSKLVEDKPVEAIKIFLKELGKLDKAAKAEAIEELGGSGQGLVQVLSKLSTNTKKLEKNLKTANTEYEVGTSLTKEYDVASQGFNAQMTLVSNSVQLAAAELGEHLAPVLLEIAKSFQTEMLPTLKATGETIGTFVIPKIKELGEAIVGLQFFLEDIGILTKNQTEFQKLAESYRFASERVASYRNELEQANTQAERMTGIKRLTEAAVAQKKALQALNKFQDESRKKAEEVAKAKVKAAKKSSKAIIGIEKKAAKTNKKLSDKKLKEFKKAMKKFNKLTMKSFDFSIKEAKAEAKHFIKVTGDKEKAAILFSKLVEKAEKKRSDEIIKINKKRSTEISRINKKIADAEEKHAEKSIKIAEKRRLAIIESEKDLTTKTNEELFKRLDDTEINKNKRLKIHNELNTRIHDGNISLTDSFKAGWKKAIEDDKNSFKKSSERMADFAETAYKSMKGFQKDLIDKMWEGGADMEDIWEGVGKVVTTLSKDAFSKAVDLIVEKTAGSAAAALGMGAASASGWGSGKGGWKASAAEVAKYLISAGLGYAAGRALADKKAYGGPIFNGLGTTGLIKQGTSPIADDVLVRSTPKVDVMASRGEFIVNAESTKNNFDLINFINRKRKKVFAGGGFFGELARIDNTPYSTQDLTGGIFNDATSVTGEQPFSEQVKNLADIMIAGGVLSFLVGWGQGGDAYKGIGKGAGQAIAYAGSTLGNIATTKASTFLFEKEGGCTMDCFSCGGCTDRKKRKHKLLGGGFSVPGVSQINDSINNVTDTVRDLPGGDFFADSIKGIGDFSERCLDSITDPGRIMSTFIAEYMKQHRASVIPIAKETLNPITGFNPSGGIWEGVLNSIFTVKSFSDMLGECSPQHAFESIPGLAHGGIVTKPTIARLAEGGQPEAVIPLDRLSNKQSGTTIIVNVNNLFAKDFGAIIDEISEDNRIRNRGDFRIFVQEQNTQNVNLVDA